MEVGIRLDELSTVQQALVQSENPGAERIFAEVVYEWDGRRYEAYFFRDGRVVKKIEFDDHGHLRASDD